MDLKELYYTAADIAELLGVSMSKAYEIIRILNKELSDKDYLTLRGKVPRVFFSEKWYGGTR